MAKDKKIDPKQLVEDVHHFTELLKNISLKPAAKTERYIDYYEECFDEGYDEEYQIYFVDDEEDCYGMDVKMAKKSKKKNGKNKKKGTNIIGSNTTVMLQ